MLTARPRKKRIVSAYPSLSSFIPKGVSPNGEVVLSVEELEAIRLSDFEKLDQGTAAGIMAVSRQTCGRILNQARTVVSEALVTGKALVVDGGTFKLRGLRRLVTLVFTYIFLLNPGANDLF